MTTQCVYNVPMALSQSMTHTRGLEPERGRSRNRRAVEDAKAYTVGPMPVQEFIDTFLPSPPSSSNATTYRRSSRRAFRPVPQRAATSAEINGPLLRSLNNSSKVKSRCPGFVFSPSKPSLPRKLGTLKPDICCYAAENIGVVDTAHESSRTEFGYAELFIEVKPNPSHDFFVDLPAGSSEDFKARTPPVNTTSSDEDEPPPRNDFMALFPYEPYAERRRNGLGQHILYVTEIFARQHRCFLFTISMSGSRARLLRWDRAGCVVSAAFDIREEPDLLCEFLWRFSQTTMAGRGHDPTVVVATPAEETLFRDALREYVRGQLNVDGTALDRAVSEHYQPGHVTAIHVLPHEQIATSDNIRRFVVSRPVVSPLHLTGRATRGFWAVDVLTRRVVFLKDTWRSSSKIEGVILQALHDRGVGHIPTLLCHGDVLTYIPNTEHAVHETQCSMTDEHCFATWTRTVRGRQIRVGKHQHYRIVLGTVGYDLRHIRGTDELLHATFDAFHAVRDAYTLGHCLHRDISVGNIILVQDQPFPARRKGYLIDWDSSCELDDSGASLDPGRAGTWLFMSANVLGEYGPTRKHTLQDDMESLLYVVLYCSFLWLPHNLSKSDLHDTIRGLFEETVWVRGSIRGGDGKVANAAYRQYTECVEFNKPLLEWLNVMMDYNSPPNNKRYKLKGKWDDPAVIEQLWADFLQAHTLPDIDRVVHDHPHATDKYEPHYTEDYSSAEAVSLSVKRPSPDREDDDDVPSAPVAKKARIIASSPPPLRRSPRERRQTNRVSVVSPPRQAPRRKPTRSKRATARHR
ncbi:hypothetical protein C8Q76DRAFT_733247 [Earliella scabrosa]|nr:hypothetical protein C8Q76DRAFT_733247 [Earliella scabrosa]